MTTLDDLRETTSDVLGVCRRCKADNPKGSGANVQISLTERTAAHKRITGKSVAMCESCAVEAYERFHAFIAEAPA